MLVRPRRSTVANGNRTGGGSSPASEPAHPRPVSDLHGCTQWAAVPSPRVQLVRKGRLAWGLGQPTGRPPPGRTLRPSRAVSVQSPRRCRISAAVSRTGRWDLDEFWTDHPKAASQLSIIPVHEQVNGLPDDFSWAQFVDDAFDIGCHQKPQASTVASWCAVPGSGADHQSTTGCRPLLGGNIVYLFGVHSLFADGGIDRLGRCPTLGLTVLRHVDPNGIRSAAWTIPSGPNVGCPERSDHCLGGRVGGCVQHHELTLRRWLV